MAEAKEVEPVVSQEAPKDKTEKEETTAVVEEQQQQPVCQLVCEK